MTAAMTTSQVAAGIARKVAKEAVDGNPGKVVDEEKLLETDKTLLEDLGGKGFCQGCQGSLREVWWKSSF